MLIVFKSPLERLGEHCSLPGVGFHIRQHQSEYRERTYCFSNLHSFTLDTYARLRYRCYWTTCKVFGFLGWNGSQHLFGLFHYVLLLVSYLNISELFLKIQVEPSCFDMSLCENCPLQVSVITKMDVYSATPRKDLRDWLWRWNQQMRTEIFRSWRTLMGITS